MEKPFIYFDQGQVLFTNDWEFPSEEKDRLFYGYYGLSPETFYPARKTYIKDLQRGKITERDNWQKVLKKTGANNSDPEFAISLARKYQAWIPGMEDLVRKLHEEGYPLGIITTSHREIWEFKVAHFGIKKIFRQMITSYETGYIKPEKEIYETALAKAGQDPEGVIYIDDSKENIEAAKSLGIEVIIFTGAEGFKDRLAARGVNI
jgi:HAD superfamily hydrolase (TIGR01509 family)